QLRSDVRTFTRQGRTICPPRRPISGGDCAAGSLLACRRDHGLVTACRSPFTWVVEEPFKGCRMNGTSGRARLPFASPPPLSGSAGLRAPSGPPPTPICYRHAQALKLKATVRGERLFGGERPGKFIWFAHPKGEDSLVAQG